MVLLLFAAGTEEQERHSTDMQTEKIEIDLVEEIAAPVIGMPSLLARFLAQLPFSRWRCYAGGSHHVAIGDQHDGVPIDLMRLTVNCAEGFCLGKSAHSCGIASHDAVRAFHRRSANLHLQHPVRNKIIRMFPGPISSATMPCNVPGLLTCPKGMWRSEAEPKARSAAAVIRC